MSSILFLMISVFQPSNSFALNICFDESVAKQMAAELKTCRETDSAITQLTDKISLERKASNDLVNNLTKRLTLCTDQTQDEHNRAEAYRVQWKECGKALTTCQQSKPSRTTWFGAGFGSALIIAIVVIAL